MRATKHPTVLISATHHLGVQQARLIEEGFAQENEQKSKLNKMFKLVLQFLHVKF